MGIYPGFYGIFQHLPGMLLYTMISPFWEKKNPVFIPCNIPPTSLSQEVYFLYSPEIGNEIELSEDQKS